MLALANPRPAATASGPRNSNNASRSRRSSTLPSRLLSGYANGPDAGRAPSRLMRAMGGTGTRGSHYRGTGGGCGVDAQGQSAAEERHVGTIGVPDNGSFENVFLGYGADDDDDDAIPLVPLGVAQVRAKTMTGGGGKMKGRMMMEQEEQEQGDGEQQNGNNGGSSNGSGGGRRRKRVYRYVSHGIGGAGNFRKLRL